MADWFTPLLSTLNSSDPLALQQIFRSISQEFARLNKEIDDLKARTGGGDMTNKSKVR